MKSYIRMTFGTSSGKDLVLNIPDVDEAVTDDAVKTSMTDIRMANAIDKIALITTSKSAVLCKAVVKAFEVA